MVLFVLFIRHKFIQPKMHYIEFFSASILLEKFKQLKLLPIVFQHFMTATTHAVEK